MEKDLKALGNASASKDDISRVRAELKKLYEGLHVGSSRIATFCMLHLNLHPEFLDLRTHVWGIRKSFRFYQVEGH